MIFAILISLAFNLNDYDDYTFSEWTVIAAQDTERYNEYTRYMIYKMYTGGDGTEQIIYRNIVDRTFSLNLDIDDFYDEVNHQARCAVTVLRLFMMDETAATGEYSGLYMVIFQNAMEEGVSGSIDWKQSMESQFDRHMDWPTILQSYTLGAGIVRARQDLEKDFEKMEKFNSKSIKTVR